MKTCKMKILILLILSIFMAMHSCVVSADENLITSNPGFENSVTSWSFGQITDAGGQVSTDDDFVHEGRFCLKMELPTAQNSATMGNYNKSFSNAMQLEVGSMYEFSIWINTGDSTLSGGEGAYAMVRAYKADDGSGAGTGNAYYSTNHVKDTQGEWVKLSARFQAVVACPIQYIYIGFDANTSGTVYWDDARLAKYNDTISHFGYFISDGDSDTEVFELVPDVNIKAKYHIGTEADAPQKVIMVSALYATYGWGASELIDIEVVKQSISGATTLWQTKGFTVTGEQMERGSYFIKTVCFDSINSLKPVKPASVLKEADEQVFENLFQNGDFEIERGNGASSWTPYDYSWNNAVSLCTQDVYSGKNCVKIASQTASESPYIRYDMQGLAAKTEYCLNIWYKTHATLGGTPVIKFQYYNDNTAMGASQAIFEPTGGVWKNQLVTVVTPENCNRMAILLRINNTGEIFYDKAAFYATKLPEALIIGGDTFFYTEWETGTVSVRVNDDVYNISADTAITVKLKDGDTVLLEKSFMAAEEESFSFHIPDLREIGKAYTLEATLYDALGGNEVGKCEKNIYRYNRPSALNEKGEFIDGGEVFVPVFGYHVYEADARLKAAKAAGVNVVQGGGSTVASAQRYLDNCYANGMKATLLLYDGMKIAGSEERIENTIEVVTAMKDHPALFGYLVMDEPYLHYADPYDDLVKTYKTIRDIDPVHPVIIQDSASTASSTLCASCSDILIIHDYALNIKVIDSSGIAGTTNTVQNAINAFSGTNIRQKPIYFLGQTFGAATREEAEANGSNYYLPTIDEAKNMLYQGAWLGVHGIGYYSFKETSWELTDTPLYSGLVDFAEEELSSLIDEFILEKHTLIRECKEGEYWWRISKDAEDDVYILVLNMSNDAVDVDLSLSDCITSYNGEKIGGTGLPQAISGNGSICLEMISHGTAFYKLTPNTN